MAEQRFLRPLDVLYLRGNRLFGEAGAHSEAEMPPWPTVAAGALRSRMLADADVDLHAFAGGIPAPHDVLEKILGTPERPGTFTLTTLLPARRTEEGVGPLFPLPADLVVYGDRSIEEVRRLDLEVPRARLAEDGLLVGHPLPHLPVLRRREAGKPLPGPWLTSEGLRSYLGGGVPRPEQVLRSGDLWKTETRLGVALETMTRTVRSGALYTSEVVAPSPDPAVGFFVEVTGADGHVPRDGLLRFGGDGRAVAVEPVELPWPPEPDWERIERERRFLLILRTPGIFPDGWRPPGLGTGDLWHGPLGVSARLVAAVVPRARVVSGWDLARGKPKVAQRVVPAGTAYAFDEARGPLRDGLSELLREGFWPLLPESGIRAQRRAEGFNNLLVANWPRTDD